ncbi:ABC transporter permease [Phaeovulum vinaykumarii]|uniref:Peptide/nickel transport system permease protein n=1 Tax=Phaeovulum vinaykumarii TaxID=407234 RepID=A0A1N7M0F9_9RHOB|nr:ABC transporter permease subunit [Phaeovulum vinaykumarii]SIS79543.1 peptide/nickel transport system permease protein [Phaeovulum vinaykumarii]SOC09715.1 peptide/nickel transport system permease protein [Phaeovulum vinaykumarii]
MTASHVGAALLIAVLAFAFGVPLLHPADPVAQSLMQSLAPPSAENWLGHDHLGRSMTARLASALRLSLGLAAATLVTTAIIGVALGTLASWRGGWIDRGLTLLADSVVALPALLVVLIAGIILPNQPLAFWAGLSATLWIEIFRLTRATIRARLAAPAVAAARLLGFGPLYIFRVHLWPELAPVLRATFALTFAAVVMGIAALGFVSVGMRAPTPELGLMMVELLPYWREAPWALAQPVAATLITLLALTLVAGETRA